MDETEIELGQIVQDKISGFKGVVTMIGDHISGCTRYCAHPVDDPKRGSEQFFYASQLDVVEEETEFTEVAEGAVTESHIKLGQRVQDEVTSFEGVVAVINYSLYNCPSVCVQSTDDADESQWYDDVRLDTAGSDEVVFDFDDKVDEKTEQNTGAVSDSSSRALRAPSNSGL